MAKVTGPLFSVSARGQVGKSLIYSRWKNILYVKKYAVPADPKTPAQLAIRDYFKYLKTRWREIYHDSTGKSPQWEGAVEVSEYYATAYNYFMSVYLKNHESTLNFIHHIEAGVSFYEDHVHITGKFYFLDIGTPTDIESTIHIGRYRVSDYDTYTARPEVVGSDIVLQTSFDVPNEDYDLLNALWASSRSGIPVFMLSGAYVLPERI